MKCEVCGHEFKAGNGMHYIATDPKYSGSLATLCRTEPNLYDAFDCPQCGCQVIAGKRKPAQQGHKSTEGESFCQTGKEAGKNDGFSDLVKKKQVCRTVKVGARDMNTINQYACQEYQPEEVYTFSLVLCDNEVDRDYGYFSMGCLEKLQKLFLGKPCVLDIEGKHKWEIARIYHTHLVEIIQGEKTRAGKNLVRLIANAYLPRTQENQETIALLERGEPKEVRVSYSENRKVCGLCGKEDCQHVPGKTYQGKFAHRVLLEPADAYACVFIW